MSDTAAPTTTPSSQWRAKGEPDPHAGHYDGERAELAMGQYTDDEIANGAFMNYDRWPPLEDIVARKPGVHPPIAWMTGVKDRIRWLSRKLEKLLCQAETIPARQFDGSEESALAIRDWANGDPKHGPSNWPFAYTVTLNMDPVALSLWVKTPFGDRRVDAQEWVVKINGALYVASAGP